MYPFKFLEQKLPYNRHSNILILLESGFILISIYQIIQDNVLERNQNRKIKEIKDALLSRENQNTLINITEI